MKQTYFVQNMKCGGCKSQIISHLENMAGIVNVSVEESSGKIVIEYDEYFEENALMKKLKQLGYPLADQQNSILSKSMSYVSCMIGRIKDESSEINQHRP